jgi:hypothetical protein
MRSNNGRRLERNRKFVDSPLEGTGFEPSVPREKELPFETTLIDLGEALEADGRRLRAGWQQVRVALVARLSKILDNGVH